MYKNLYIIFTRRGINIDNYPSIKRYLTRYKKDLTPRNKNSKKNEPGRKPGSYKWYEIQDNVAYYSLFEKEKIIYSEITPEPRFYYDDEKHYMEATGFILSSSTLNLKYFLSLLNSKLLFWYFKDIGYNLGGKGFRYKKIFIEQLPIKFTNKNIELELINLVDIILDLNKTFVNEINNFHNILFEDFNMFKISNKLENYNVLDLNDFLKEIRKYGINVPNNLMKEKIISEFTLSCNRLKEINFQIEETEKKLNNLVYNIYCLNDAEIKIIEENIKILTK